MIRDEEGGGGLGIVVMGGGFGYIGVVEGGVVMEENGGNVEWIGRRDGIVGVVGGDDRIGKD